VADAFGPVAGVIQSLSKHSLTAADSMAFMTAATTLAEATGQDLTTTCVIPGCRDAELRA